jgi:hypothetical protein
MNDDLSRGKEHRAMHLNLASRLNPSTHDDSIEDVHTGLSPEPLKRDWLDNLFFIQGVFPENGTPLDLYLALAYMVRDRCCTVISNLYGASSDRTFLHRDKSHNLLLKGLG